jgi:hypothetical protein
MEATTMTKTIISLAIAGALFSAGAQAGSGPDGLNKYVDSYAGPDPFRREAGAARDEARRGELARGENAADFDRNKFARCESHSGEDRELCIRRMSGEGTVSGSVQGGGVYRELRVTVPAER